MFYDLFNRALYSEKPIKNMPNYLFYIFATVSMIAALMVITVVNPVHSVLFLVLVFLNAAGMLFVLQLEFIPLTFIIVYVGAIAILFLFVVMMLDIKVTSKSNDFFKYTPVGGLVGSLFIFEVFNTLDKSFVTPEKTILTDNFVSWVSAVDKVTNLEALGQLLYTYYFIYFLIAGMILLVAMVGAIVLTLQFNKTVKNQLIFRQLSRSADSAVFLAQNK
jgi:NADH-quinone oxidoreductase subunit J